MKKTLFITLDYPPMRGGVANYWANLNKFLPREDLIVLAQEIENAAEFDIPESYPIARKNLILNTKLIWPRWLPLLWHAYKLIRDENVERVLVTHVLPVGTAALILKALLGVPYFVSFHGLDIQLAKTNKRKLWLTRKIVKNADGIIVNSQFTLNKLKEMCDCDGKRIEIVYPCPHFNGDTPSEYFLEQFRKENILIGKKIILTVGRLVERKGHDKMIEAMPAVLQKIPNAVYCIVGSGNYELDLRQAVERLKLNEHVRFFTDVKDAEVPMFYSACDLFAMPCRELSDGDVEGFGIVYLEANTYGKPVIAGNSGGAVEAVENNINGVVVDPLNVSEIANAAIDLLINEQKAKEMGERGRVRVMERFNWKEQVGKVEGLLN